MTNEANPRAPLVILVVAAVAVACVAVACGGGSTVAVDCTQVQTYADVTAFAKCTECHSSALSGAARQNAPSDINYDSYAAAVAGAARAQREIDEGTMPPVEVARLSDDERTQIVTWATCGTPQ